MYYTKQEAQREATALLIQHHLSHWNFKFDAAKRRLGVCRHQSRTIGLSVAYLSLATKNEIKDVILHEIAHALVGKGHGHDNVWRNKLIEIGGDGQRLYKGTARVKAKFYGTCPNCGRQIEKHRRTKIACGTCCTKYNQGKFNKEYLFVWGINE